MRAVLRNAFASPIFIGNAKLLNQSWVKTSWNYRLNLIVTRNAVVHCLIANLRRIPGEVLEGKETLTNDFGRARAQPAALEGSLH
jgi:F420-0:gamma-glutamyl ligase-like protein